MYRIRIISLLLLTCLATAVSQAQTDDTYRREIGIAVGTTNYMGDFNGSLSKGYQPAAAIIFRQVFNPYSALKLDLGYTQIKGSSNDVTTFYPEYATEAYKFKRTLTDFNATYEYNFWPYGTGRDYRGAVRFTPYIFCGVGLTLATGQGSSTLTANIPLGVGVKYKIAKRMNLGVEWAFHPTLSDNLDGVADPYGIKSTGVFKNTDCYSSLKLSLTYSFSAVCPTCNKDE